MPFTGHAFTGHEDQVAFVRRGLSTANKEYEVSGNDALHATDTNLASYQATDLAQTSNPKVHEDQVHLFIRAAKLVAPALSAAGIMTDADIANNFDTQSDAQKNFTSQDPSLKPTYTASIGDS
jgi:hypothetical protein